MRAAMRATSTRPWPRPATSSPASTPRASPTTTRSTTTSWAWPTSSAPASSAPSRTASTDHENPSTRSRGPDDDHHHRTHPNRRGDERAFLLLRTVFTVAPIAFGLDKFFELLTDWEQYLAPWINDLVPGTAHQAMLAVGVSRSSPASSWPSRPATGAAGRGLAGGDHPEPGDHGRVLRRRPARLRPARRRPGARGPGVRPGRRPEVSDSPTAPTAMRLGGAQGAPASRATSLPRSRIAAITAPRGRGSSRSQLQIAAYATEPAGPCTTPTSARVLLSVPVLFHSRTPRSGPSPWASGSRSKREATPAPVLGARGTRPRSRGPVDGRSRGRCRWPPWRDLGKHEFSSRRRWHTGGPPAAVDGGLLSSRMTPMPVSAPRRPSRAARTLALLATALLALPLGASQAQTDEAEIPGKTFAAYEFGWYPIHFVDHFGRRRWATPGRSTGRAACTTQNGMLTIVQLRRRDDRRHARAARRHADRPLGDPAARPALRGRRTPTSRWPPSWSRPATRATTAAPATSASRASARPGHRARFYVRQPARPVLRRPAAGDEPPQRLLAHLRRRGDAEPDLVVRRRRGARRPSAAPRRSPGSRWRSGCSCRPSPARP